MNNKVKKILAVSAMSVAVLACDCNIASASSAVCIKPIQFIIQALIGIHRQQAKLSIDPEELRKLYNEVAKKDGDMYKTPQVPLTNAVAWNKLTSGSNAPMKVGIQSITPAMSSNNQYTNVVAQEHEIQTGGGDHCMDVKLENKFNPANNSVQAQVTYDNIDSADQAHPDYAVEGGAVHNATLQLQPISYWSNNVVQDQPLDGYANLVQKQTTPNWSMYENWESFKIHSGKKWMWNGELRLGAQFNMPMGGFMRVMVLGGLPFNKTIECTEETDNSNNSNNQTNNTENKNKSAYNLTQKWYLGALFGVGVNFTEKFYMALNLLYTYNKYAFEPKSNDSKESNSNQSSTDNTDNTIKLSNKFDMKSHDLAAEVEAGFNFTDHVGMFVGVGYKPQKTLKSNASDMIPVSVKLDNGVYFKVGVGVVF